MPIYCPQTATTYPTLTAFYDATKFLNVGRIVGEVSGTVAGGAISPTGAHYPAGVEVKAALGEEFTGVFGAGAVVTDLQWTVANTRHLLLTGVQCTQSSTTLSIITSSIWSAGDLTVDGCGFTGGATAIAPSRTGSVWQVKNSVVRGCQQSGINRGTGSGDSAYIPTLDLQNVSVYGCNLVNSIYQGGATRRIFAAGSTIKHNASLGNIYADWLRPLNLAEQNNVAFQYNASSDDSSKITYQQTQSNEFNSLTGVTPASVWENPAAGDFRQKAASPLIGAGEAGANVGAFAPATAGVVPVDQALPVAWSVRGLAQQGAAMTWALWQSVLSDRALVWNLSQPVLRSDSLQWALCDAVANASEIGWSLFNSVDQSGAVVWAVLSDAQRALVLSWDVLELPASVTAAQALIWDIAGQIMAQFQPVWSVVNAVTGDATLAWTLANEVADSIAVDWDVLDAMESGIALSWDCVAATDSELVLVWNLASDEFEAPRKIVRVVPSRRVVKAVPSSRMVKVLH